MQMLVEARAAEDEIDPNSPRAPPTKPSRKKKDKLAETLEVGLPLS